MAKKSEIDALVDATVALLEQAFEIRLAEAVAKAEAFGRAALFAEMREFTAARRPMALTVVPPKDHAEMRWWRSAFATRVDDLPRVGAPLLGRRFKLVEVKPAEAHPERSDFRDTAKAQVVNRLGAIAEAAARAAKEKRAVAGPTTRGTPEYKAKLAQAVRDSWARRRAEKSGAGAVTLHDGADYGARLAAPEKAKPARNVGGEEGAGATPTGGPACAAAPTQAAPVPDEPADAGDLAGNPVDDAILALAAAEVARAPEPQLAPPRPMFNVRPIVVAFGDSKTRKRVALLIGEPKPGWFDIRYAMGMNRRYQPKSHRICAAEIIRDATDREAVLGHVP